MTTDDQSRETPAAAPGARVPELGAATGSRAYAPSPATREKKKPYHVVIDGDGCGMVITGGGREKPRGGWLARGSWLTLFPSARQARAAIVRTRQFAKDNAMPWLKDIRHYHIVAVTLSRANTEREERGV